jgi:hypothetical protein
VDIKDKINISEKKSQWITTTCHLTSKSIETNKTTNSMSIGQRFNRIKTNSDSKNNKMMKKWLMSRQTIFKNQEAWVVTTTIIWQTEELSVY